MSQITENIFLGSIKNQNDKLFLNNNNIKYVLCVADNCNLKPMSSNISLKEIPMEDFGEVTDLEQKINESNKYIDSVIEKNENILIHCRSGMNRSAFITIIYLIYKNNWEYSQAYAFVKNKRKCIKINKKLKAQFFEKVLDNI